VQINVNDATRDAVIFKCSKNRLSAALYPDPLGKFIARSPNIYLDWRGAPEKCIGKEKREAERIQGIGKKERERIEEREKVGDEINNRRVVIDVSAIYAAAPNPKY